jgi:hypothetical protein
MKRENLVSSLCFHKCNVCRYAAAEFVQLERERATATVGAVQIANAVDTWRVGLRVEG